jgi:hypothetical protein
LCDESFRHIGLSENRPDSEKRFSKFLYLESNMSRLYFAMEELDEVADAPVEDVTAFVDSPEEEAVEGTEAAADVDAGQADIDQAADAAITLDDVADRMEETVDEGGMSEGGQAAVETAVEHLLASIGYSAAKRKPMPSCESFKTGDRKANTRLAVEALKERALEIWNKITAFIKRLIVAIKNFFDITARRAEKLKTRAQSLSKAAGSITGTQKTDKISAETLLVSGGKYLEGGELMTAYRAHTVSPLLKADRFGRATKAFQTLEGAIKGGSASVDPAAILGVSEDGGKAVAKPDFSIPEKAVAYETKLPIGDLSFYTVVAEKPENTVKALLGLGQSHCKVAPSEGAKKPDGDKKVTPADAKTAEKLANAVEIHMATYKGMSDKLRTAESACDKVISDAKAAAGKAEGDAAEKFKAAAHALKGVSNALMTGSVALRKTDVNMAAQVLSYVAKSIKAYGGKADDKKEEKKEEKAPA